MHFYPFLEGKISSNCLPCQTQLLWVLLCHETELSEPQVQTRVVFLDISKAFDKVWREGLILGHKSNGIDGPLYHLIKDFLSMRFQCVNGKASSWERFLAGAPRRSVLGHPFFLVYSDDLAENVSSSVKLFADDTSIFRIFLDVNVSWQILSNNLSSIQDWAFHWKMSFNPDPTRQEKEVIFSSKRTKDHHLPLEFNDYQINVEKNYKHLGLIFDEKLAFAEHVRKALTNAKHEIGIIRFLSKYGSRDILYQL